VNGQTGSNPPWTKGRRLAAGEFADRVAKSRWLRIQSVNRVFALTLTLRLGFRTSTIGHPGALADVPARAKIHAAGLVVSRPSSRGIGDS
jgi:hypothetical protein